MPHRLSNADYRSILGALEAAHWARDREALFVSVCGSLERCISSSSGVLLPLDPAAGTFRREGAVNVHVDDRAFADFFTYYAPRHPLVEKNLHRTTVNQSLRLTDYVPRSKLDRTEWGRDFQPRAGIFHELSVNLGFDGIPVAGMAVHRSREAGDFTKRDVAVLDVMVPHLSALLHSMTVMESAQLSLDSLRSRFTGFGLSKREWDVAALVAGGLSNRHVARRLFISELTVKDHLKKIFRKLDIERRSQLAVLALGRVPRSSPRR
ncbi:MAG: helix-turn-helix transcriptional regulator [Gammaproteobacteria bacterium]|nr:helix-turn-helix transcriptional regulator [Gammaproteobacteria bacterium]